MLSSVLISCTPLYAIVYVDLVLAHNLKNQHPRNLKNPAPCQKDSLKTLNTKEANVLLWHNTFVARTCFYHHHVNL
jgi:hypothetical protein